MEILENVNEEILKTMRERLAEDNSGEKELVIDWMDDSVQYVTKENK